MSAKMFKNLPTSSLAKQISRINMIAGTPKNAYRFGDNTKKIEVILLEKNIIGPRTGLRKFLKLQLPTLKFHNENVDFFCTRVRATSKDDIAKVPTKIVIHDASNNKTEIDCHALDEQKILKKLIKATEATRVPESEIPHLQHPFIAL